jgi:excisionase family DNA binding protein
MGDLVLTREETAGALRLSLRTVDNLIARGELRVRRVGRRVLIPCTEVERFADNSTPSENSGGSNLVPAGA